MARAAQLRTDRSRGQLLQPGWPFASRRPAGRQNQGAVRGLISDRRNLPQSQYPRNGIGDPLAGGANAHQSCALTGPRAKIASGPRALKLRTALSVVLDAAGRKGTPADD